MEKAHVTDHLIGADQKILDWPVKTAYPGEIEIAIRLGIEPRFCNLA